MTTSTSDTCQKHIHATGNGRLALSPCLPAVLLASLSPFFLEVAAAEAAAEAEDPKGKFMAAAVSSSVPPPPSQVLIAVRLPPCYAWSRPQQQGRVVGVKSGEHSRNVVAAAGS